MSGVSGVASRLIPVEQAVQQGNFQSLKICVDLILGMGVKSTYVSWPLDASRLKRFLRQDGAAQFLGGERMQKIEKLLNSGPLRKDPELLDAALDYPEHVQTAVVATLDSPWGIDSKSYTQDQAIDILRFALERKRYPLFDSVLAKTYGLSAIKRDGDKVVISPHLLPVYLENSSRGAFLREHCHGFIKIADGPELELLRRYFPASQRHRFTTLWVDISSSAASFFAQPLTRLVIHGGHIAKNLDQILQTLALFPWLKEVVFDGVTWAEEWEFHSHKAIHRTFYETIQNYSISLRDVKIKWASTFENLGKIVKLPDHKGCDSMVVTVEANPMVTEEENAAPFEPRDRVHDSSLVSYFCPEILKDIMAGDFWFFDNVLMNVDAEICKDTIKIPELRTPLFVYAEEKFVQEKITLETITKLVGTTRLLNYEVNWFAGPRCETNFCTKNGKVVAWPTLPLMVEAGSRLFDQHVFDVSPEVLEAIRSWLLNPGSDIELTGKDLLDLEMLAEQLQFQGIRESYTSKALRGLDEKQIEQFLDRIPVEEHQAFITDACSVHPYNHSGSYLSPNSFLRHISDPSPWGKRLRPMIDGVVLGSADMNELIELVSSPEALKCIREIFLNGLGSSIDALPALVECCENLSRVVINPHTTLSQERLRELARLSGDFTLLLTQASFEVDNQDRWTDLGINESIHVQFKNVRRKVKETGEEFLIHAKSPYLEGSTVKIIHDEE